MPTSQPKTAIINDFFFQNGGAEKVVEELLNIYPESDVFSTIFIESKFRDSPQLTRAWNEGRVRTTWLQWFFVFNNGFLLRFFKHFFWLYPIVMRGVRVHNYDLVIISSTDCAKQVDLEGNQKLLHYCHTPTRYLHNLITETDHSSLGLLQRIMLKVIVPIIRKMDLQAVNNLKKNNCIWIANSRFIQGLIKDKYTADSTIIFPPIDLEKFLPIVPKKINIWTKDSYLLSHGRISFHKRIDLAIESCLELGINLKISGISAVNGQIESLKRIITDYQNANPDKVLPHIEFLGRTSDEQLFQLIENCSGFIFPGKEDFGITPVEMLASGIPLIAYGEGGALEYVTQTTNGVFFENQSIEELIQAILEFQKITFDVGKIKQTSKEFSTQRFVDGIKGIG